MKFDAFTAGVNPGGLRSKIDIKLLICYILTSIKEPMSKEDVISILQNNNLANYFDTSDSFSDLFESGNIKKVNENSNLYTVTESGKLIATHLDSALPITIREKALCATINLMAKIKRETENTVDIKKDKNGYSVTCNISGGEIDLLSFNLYVPDKLQAELVKENFQKNPGVIYECLLALLTKDKELAKNAMKDI